MGEGGESWAAAVLCADAHGQSALNCSDDVIWRMNFLVTEAIRSRIRPTLVVVWFLFLKAGIQIKKNISTSLNLLYNPWRNIFFKIVFTCRQVILQGFRL